jgi:hypothetical protein
VDKASSEDYFRQLGQDYSDDLPAATVRWKKVNYNKCYFDYFIVSFKNGITELDYQDKDFSSQF